MDTSNFDALLQRYLDGKATPEEKIKIEAWLEVRKTKNATNLELSAEDQERLFRKIVSKTTGVSEVSGFLPGHKKPFPFRMLGVAASIVLIAVAGFYWWAESDSFQANTASRKLILDDGSIVWPDNETTSLAYYEKDGTRYCDLRGDALFEVAKDPDHPFIIQSGNVRLRVLGTSFHIQHQGDSMEISVLTGKVLVSTQKNAEGIQVAAREKALAIPDGNILRSSLARETIAEISMGTDYNMAFADQELRHVLSRIERKFDVQFSVESESLYNCRITADFTDHSLASTLGMISEVLGIEYQVEKNKVHIAGTGCAR
jgi:ferric-dicitrate binding protein FerR (iron transport regulator)